MFNSNNSTSSSKVIYWDRKNQTQASFRGNNISIEALLWPPAALAIQPIRDQAAKHHQELLHLLVLHLVTERHHSSSSRTLLSVLRVEIHLIIIGLRVPIMDLSLSRKRNYSSMLTASTTSSSCKWFSQTVLILILKVVSSMWWMLLNFQIRRWRGLYIRESTFHCRRCLKSYNLRELVVAAGTRLEDCQL